MLFFRLSPHCTHNGTRIFYDYTTPTRYSNSSRSVLTGKHTLFDFQKTAVAIYSSLSTLLGCASKLSPIVLTFSS